MTKLTPEDLVVISGCDALCDIDEVKLCMMEAIAQFGRDNARSNEMLDRAFVALRKAAEQMTKYKKEARAATPIPKNAAA